MSGFELVAGVVAAFFAFGIMTGVFAVIALDAMRRARVLRRPEPEDGSYWGDRLEPDDGDGTPPPWPGYRHLLTGGH